MVNSSVESKKFQVGFLERTSTPKGFHIKLDKLPYSVYDINLYGSIKELESFLKGEKERIEIIMYENEVT